jgi:hypothetical protein
MKKFLILSLSMIAGCGAFAQQKGKTDYMSITIYQQAAQFRNLIITRTDSAQKTIDFKTKLHAFGAEIKYLAEQDSVLLQLVKPYYDKGWKLVSFTTDGSDFNNNGMAFRYYLSRDEQ